MSERVLEDTKDLCNVPWCSNEAVVFVPNGAGYCENHRAKPTEATFRDLAKRLQIRARDIYNEFGTENSVGCALDIVADEILDMLVDNDE